MWGHVCEFVWVKERERGSEREGAIYEFDWCIDIDGTLSSRPARRHIQFIPAKLNRPVPTGWVHLRFCLPEHVSLFQTHNSSPTSHHPVLQSQSSPWLLSGYRVSCWWHRGKSVGPNLSSGSVGSTGRRWMGGGGFTVFKWLLLMFASEQLRELDWTLCPWARSEL